MPGSASDFRGLDVPSALWAPVRWTGIHLSALLGLLVGAWIADWIFVLKVWSDGVGHLEAVLDGEVARLQDLDCWCSNLQGTAVGFANALYGVLFELTGIQGMATQLGTAPSLSIPDTIVRQLFTLHAEEIRTVMVGTQLFGVRMAALINVMPLVGVAYAVGIADGLVMRAIRCACGGQESAAAFHRRKYLQLTLAVGSVAILLVSPMPIASDEVRLVIVALLAWLARGQCKFLRKWT